MVKKNRDAFSLLTSLGVSFSREMDINLCPEEALISLIEDFNILENRRLLSLTILAFENLQDYLRPDLLSHLAARISVRGKAVLGGIIFRNNLNGPARWKKFKKFLLSDRLKNEILIGSPLVIELKGVDPYFLEFGIKITPIAKSEDKKLFRNNWLFRHNPWFGNRILFGPGSRADISTIRSNQLESVPYRIAKRFNCSIPSITKAWNDLILAQSLGYEVTGR
jgi:hypothetical protein